MKIHHEGKRVEATPADFSRWIRKPNFLIVARLNGCANATSLRMEECNCRNGDEATVVYYSCCSAHNTRGRRGQLVCPKRVVQKTAHLGATSEDTWRGDAFSQPLLLHTSW